MFDQLLDSWDIHNRMLFMLFDAIDPEQFRTEKGRSVGSIFAHLNNIRLAWIEASAPALLEGRIKIPAKTKADRAAISKEILRPALESSAQGIRELLETGRETGKLKNLKPHLFGRFSYFIAHEWYHIGEIGILLKESGYKLDEKTEYGIWSWGRWNPGQGNPDED